MNQKIMLDGNIITGQKEIVTDPNHYGFKSIVPPTEMGEALEHLNRDVIDEKTFMTAIDMRTRLSSTEIAGISAIDTLIALKVIPKDTIMITRQKKRLSVSLDGKGRDEIVDIVSGKRMTGMFGSRIEEISKSVMGLGGDKK